MLVEVVHLVDIPIEVRVDDDLLIKVVWHRVSWGCLVGGLRVVEDRYLIVRKVVPDKRNLYKDRLTDSDRLSTASVLHSAHRQTITLHSVLVDVFGVNNAGWLAVTCQLTLSTRVFDFDVAGIFGVDKPKTMKRQLRCLGARNQVWLRPNNKRIEVAVGEIWVSEVLTIEGDFKGKHIWLRVCRSLDFNLGRAEQVALDDGTVLLIAESDLQLGTWWLGTLKVFTIYNCVVLEFYRAILRWDRKDRWRSVVDKWLALPILEEGLPVVALVVGYLERSAGQGWSSWCVPSEGGRCIFWSFWLVADLAALWVN